MLDEDGPEINGHREGQSPAALLFKAWGLRYRVGTLEKWARESRRGGGPPLIVPPHYTALAAQALSANAALVFVAACRLPPDCRFSGVGDGGTGEVRGAALDLGGTERAPE